MHEPINAAQTESHADGLAQYIDPTDIQHYQDVLSELLAISCVLIDNDGRNVTTPSFNCHYRRTLLGTSQSNSLCRLDCFRKRPDQDKLLSVRLDGNRIAQWCIGHAAYNCPVSTTFLSEPIACSHCDKSTTRGKDTFTLQHTAMILGLLTQQIQMRAYSREQIAELEDLRSTITHLNLHDPLTGLGNIIYLECVLEPHICESGSPHGILYCDVDGLHLVNDLYGRKAGDRVLMDMGRYLSELAGSSANVVRVGGDEFVVLFRDYDEAELDRIALQITAEAGQQIPSPIEISVTVGTYTFNEGELQAAISQAEKRMQNKKLLGSQSGSSGTVLSIRRMLEEKTHETEAHCWRLRHLICQLAEALGVKSQEMAEYELLALMHDIGKVAIPDHILNKPEALTDDEWSVMRTHSEIGARIVASIPQISGISKAILHHHENWNGSGYPAGIHHDQIPLQSRILAVVDAFDVMTNDRIYRKARTSAEALAELQRCAGIQFDPHIVASFVSLIKTLEPIAKSHSTQSRRLICNEGIGC